EVAQFEAAAKQLATLSADLSEMRTRVGQDIAALQGSAVDFTRPLAATRKLQTAAAAENARWDDIVRKLESELAREQEKQQREESERLERERTRDIEAPHESAGKAPATAAKKPGAPPPVGNAHASSEAGQGPLFRGRWGAGHDATFQVDDVALEVKWTGKQ